jgi:hypothetical protein
MLRAQLLRVVYDRRAQDCFGLVGHKVARSECTWPSVSNSSSAERHVESSESRCQQARYVNERQEASPDEQPSSDLHL